MRSVTARAYVGPRHRWRVRMLADVVRDEHARGTHRSGACRSRATGAGPDGDDGDGGDTRYRELILDAGCGDGSLSLELARTGHGVVGIDLDLGRLHRASRRARHAGLGWSTALVCADLRALPFRDSGFCAAASGEVLEHIDDDACAVRELARVLQVGGSVAVTVPAGPERFGSSDRRAGHVRRYDRAGLARLLSGAGLRVTTLVGWGYPFGRLYDRWAQRPALAMSEGSAGGLIAVLGRSRVVWRLWKVLFGLDERVPAGGRGSGWLAVARKTKPSAGLPRRSSGLSRRSSGLSRRSQCHARQRVSFIRGTMARYGWTIRRCECPKSRFTST